jgi:hypothetical protein
MNSEGKLLKMLSEELCKSIDSEILKNLHVDKRHIRIKRIIEQIKSSGLSAEQRRVPKP